jgi:tripartite-type tricarboxylate transporter receptor subunit TctC
MNRRHFALAALAIAALGAQPALAQTQSSTWPQRSVRFILPLGPGSGVDIGSRLIADRLAQKWGRPVVIENKPGGDAIVAITAFTAANDDHTFLMAPTSTFTAHPFLHEKLAYDLNDLVPIARVSNTIVAVGVPTALGINTLDELIARAKAQPGQLNSAGTTGAIDFVVAGYLKKAGAEITKVPYRDGVQALNDLAEGRIQLYVAALAIMRPQVQAGKVKIIAVTNNERAPIMPDVPTAVEAKHPQLAVDGLIGLFGIRGLPDDLRNRIAADIKEAASDPEIAAKINATAQIVRPGGPAEFAKELDTQIKVISDAAAAAGVKRMLQN